MKYKVGDVLVLINYKMATVLYANDKLKYYHVEMNDAIPGWGKQVTDIREDEIIAGTPTLMKAEPR